ncbi:MAG: DUF2889 domain-containing protein [Francisellaceae bacterium]
MPLSESKSLRKKIYARHITYETYVLDVGGWEVEIFLTDRKTYDIVQHDGVIRKANKPYHDMAMRVCISQEMEIKDIELSMDATPFSVCPGAMQVYKKLIGVKLDFHWMRNLNPSW